MKNLGAIFALLTAGRLVAAPELSLSVREPLSHLFDDQLAQINLQVEAPLGSNVSIRADISQVAAGIAAPLATDLKIANGVEFLDRTFVIVPAAIALPVVKNKAELRVRFRTEQEGVGASTEARIFVYPKGLPDRLKKAADIAVFGESARLRAFLTEQKIPFTEGGEGRPSSFKPELIYLTEADAFSPAEGRVVFFSNDKEVPPGIYRRETAAGVTTKVTLPILENLSTNPLSQEILAQVLGPNP